MQDEAGLGRMGKGRVTCGWVKVKIRTEWNELGMVAGGIAAAQGRLGSGLQQRGRGAGQAKSPAGSGL